MSDAEAGGTAGAAGGGVLMSASSTSALVLAAACACACVWPSADWFPSASLGFTVAGAMRLSFWPGADTAPSAPLSRALARSSSSWSAACACSCIVRSLMDRSQQSSTSPGHVCALVHSPNTTPAP